MENLNKRILLVILLCFIESLRAFSQDISRDSVECALRIKKELSIQKKIYNDSIKLIDILIRKEKNKIWLNKQNNIFKIDILSLFINEISIYYEKKFASRYSIVTSFGIYYNLHEGPYFSPRNLILWTVYASSKESLYHKGFGFRFMPKYYLNNNLFISSGIHIKYNYCDNNEVVIGLSDFQEHIQIRTDRFYFTSLAVELGFKTPRRNDIFNFYTKFAYNYKFGKSEIYEDYWSYYHYSNVPTPKKESISIFYPTFNLGVRLSIFMFKNKKA